MMNNMLAPIVLFVYNRPLHTQNVLNSLSLNKESAESVLYIFCDGPKKDASEDIIQNINKTKTVVKKEKRFKEIIIIENVTNKGLANSIIDGVTEVINKHDKVIVIEDDLILSPFFLFYMNDSLIRYENNYKVGQIGACNFFACGKKYPTTFFTSIPDCLGWATWKNRWNRFNPNAVTLLNLLEEKKLTRRFNVYDSYNMIEMLKMQIDNKINSWAIRWQAVCVLNHWLTLYPNPSFTNHIESTEATHANINIIPPICVIKPKLKTVEVKENKIIINAMIKGYNGTGNYYGEDKSKFSLMKHIYRLFTKAKVTLK